jgi:fibronectin type 3 domain-containing protein
VVVGYYIYRGTGGSGSLFELSSGIVPSTSYRDSTVVSGQTYTYAVTSVDSSGVESVFSASVTVRALSKLGGGPGLGNPRCVSG